MGLGTVDGGLNVGAAGEAYAVDPVESAAIASGLSSGTITGMPPARSIASGYSVASATRASAARPAAARSRLQAGEVPRW